MEELCSFICIDCSPDGLAGEESSYDSVDT